MMTLGRSGPTRIALVCITLISVSGCTRQAPIADAAPKSIAVRTVAVTEEQIDRTTTQPATVHAYYRAQIQARVSGYVSELKADIGDPIQAGDVLAVLQIPEMEKQLEIIKARIILRQAQETQAQAGLELAAANVESAKAKLVQAKSEAASAEASLAAAEAQFSRTKDLVDRQSLQQRVLDEVRKERDSELARRDAVESLIKSAEADVKVAEAKRTSAEADVKAAEAETLIAKRELEEAEVMVEFATLRAPLTGIVTQRSIDLGDLVQVGNQSSKPLMVVSQVDKLRVHVPVPESDAAQVNRGDHLSLTFPSFSGEQEVNATVTRTSGDLDPQTRTMLVEAELDNPDRKLLPGMFGEASITLKTELAANMLPARAIRFDENGAAYVYLVDQDDIVEVMQVTTGIDDGQSIEILSGVRSGQRVVDAHLRRFTTGQKVSSIN